MPACTDTTTKPFVVEAGVRVLDEPFHARGPLATAGGCMASVYLAAWVMAKRSIESAEQSLRYVAPVGRKDSWVEEVLGVVKPFLAAAA